ncbi:MAG: hypothetical protein QXM92_03505 [Candidatus Anstonellales archaeon]
MGAIPSSTSGISIKLSSKTTRPFSGEAISAPTTANYSAWYRSKDIYQLLSEREKLKRRIQKLSTDPSGYGAYQEQQLRRQMEVLDVYLTRQSAAQLESAVLSISSTVIGANAQAGYIRARTRQAIDYSVQSRGQVTIEPIKNTSNVNNHKIPRNGFNKKIQKINSNPNTTPNQISGTQLKVLWGSQHSQVVRALQQRLNQLSKLYNC